MGELSEAEKLLAQKVAEEKKNHPEWYSGKLSSLLDENLTQRQFDFTTEKDVAEEIAVQMESLNQTELKLMKEQMEHIVKDSQKEQKRKSRCWFENVVIPVLKDYAERSETCLDLSEEQGEEIIATIRNRSGFDIISDDHRMKMLLLLAGHISIEKCDDNLVVVLAFDLEYFFR